MCIRDSFWRTAPRDLGSMMPQPVGESLDESWRMHSGSRSSPSSHKLDVFVISGAPTVPETVEKPWAVGDKPRRLH
eukprot:8268720-Pyramimonas_sp.AAC.1